MTPEEKQRIEQTVKADLAWEEAKAKAAEYSDIVYPTSYTDPTLAALERSARIEGYLACWKAMQPKPETFTREEVEKLLEWIGEHEMTTFCEDHEPNIVYWETCTGKPMGTTSQLIDKFKTK